MPTSSTPLSPHWSLEELGCKDGCKGEQQPAIKAALSRLVSAGLEPLRILCGHPLHATCGYRCPKHNAAVGGAKASEHLVGIAADLEAADQIKLAAEASRVPGIGGIGLYPNKGILHVDVRPRVKGAITWWEQVGGRYIPLRPETRKALSAAGAKGL